MARYRKKPREVEAFRFLVDDEPDWSTVKRGKTFCSTDEEHGEYCQVHGLNHIERIYTVKTLEGVELVEPGDWIIRGSKGVYPCKPDIFKEDYEPIEREEHHA